MRFSSAFLAALAASIFNTSLAGTINTQGTPTSCGTGATCCIPSCKLYWTDNSGCSGSTATIGSCSEAWSDAEQTVDNGVDICDGAGAFFCFTRGGSRAIFVVNRDGAVNTELYAAYDECTLSGQCAGCDGEIQCSTGPNGPVTIATAYSGDHSCKNFNDLLDSVNGGGLVNC